MLAVLEIKALILPASFAILLSEAPVISTRHRDMTLGPVYFNRLSGGTTVQLLHCSTTQKPIDVIIQAPNLMTPKKHTVATLHAQPSYNREATTNADQCLHFPRRTMPLHVAQ